MNSLPACCRNADARFTFREVRSVPEVESVLAARYRAYSGELGLGGRLASLDATSGLDLDAHDPVSRHFALFAHQDEGDTVVGTLRIAGTEPGPAAPALHRIATHHPSLRSRLDDLPKVPLPMLAYLEHVPAVKTRYEQSVLAGERVAEPGRLSVEPGARRMAARAGAKLSYFLMCCAEAAGWFQLGLDRVVMDCDVRLVPFYQSFGFAPLTGVGPTRQSELGITFMVLEATPASMPAPVRSEVERLAAELQESGQAVLDLGVSALVQPAA
jgi:hypothetical protein